MVLSYEGVYGKKKSEVEEGPEQVGPSLHRKFTQEKDDERESIKPEGVKKMAKQYKALINQLVENGAVHAIGQIIMVPLTDERATNLINAGYIEEVVEVKEVEVKKEIEAPIKKVITGEDTDKKTATGVGAGLLKKKGKK